MPGGVETAETVETAKTKGSLQISRKDRHEAGRLELRPWAMLLGEPRGFTNMFNEDAVTWGHVWARHQAVRLGAVESGGIRKEYETMRVYSNGRRRVYWLSSRTFFEVDEARKRPGFEMSFCWVGSRGGSSKWELHLNQAAATFLVLRNPRVV
jgi:hypothetical protein